MILEKDAEERRQRRKMKEEKANGVCSEAWERNGQFVFCVVSLQRLDLLCPRLTRSVKASREWGFHSRWLRNGCQVLYWRLGPAAWHAGSLHKQSTGTSTFHFNEFLYNNLISQYHNCYSCETVPLVILLSHTFMYYVGLYQVGEI